MSKILDEKVSVRLFVEEINFVSNQLFSTRKVIEFPFFNSLVWKTSLDFQKSATISFDNPLEKLSTSVRHPDSLSVSPEKKVMDSEVERYCSEVFRSFGDRLTKFNSGQTDTPETFLRGDDFLLGIENPESYFYTEDSSPICLTVYQRVWIVSESYVGDDTDKKYSVWAGVVTGFNETSSETGNTFTVTVSGLSRFLDLTNIYENYRLTGFSGDLIENYLNVLNENLYSNYKGTQLLTSLPLVSLALLPVFLANFFYTSQGNKKDYDPSSGKPVDKNFFLQDVLWRLNVDESNCWDAITQGSEGALMGKRGDPEYLSGIVNRLFSGETVSVYALTPSVYVDPLLIEIFNNNRIRVMNILLQQVFNLIDETAITAKDLLVKVAQNTMAAAYEDDYGNIILEVSRLWSAPENPDGFVVTPEYRNVSFLKDYGHSRDYVLPDSCWFSHTKGFNEGNLITHVEVPSGFDYSVLPSEFVTRTRYTGRTSTDDPEILKIQRRYGVRSLVTSNLALAVMSLGIKYDDYIAALNAFAKSVLSIRNHSTIAITLNTRFLNHLAINKNILFLKDESLCLLNEKTLTYNLGEESASYSCDFVLSYRHRLNESLTYPFYDLILGG